MVDEDNEEVVKGGRGGNGGRGEGEGGKTREEGVTLVYASKQSVLSFGSLQ